MMDVSEWDGEALDYAVEQALEGPQIGPTCDVYIKPPPYSTDWSLAGPIIEREEIRLNCADDKTWWAEIHMDRNGATAHQTSYDKAVIGRGPTALIAAMRAFVAASEFRKNSERAHNSETEGVAK